LSEPRHDCNVVLVGDCRVGKSALVNRFINNKFNEYYRATQFEKYTTSALVANRRVKYTIWDTAGSHATSSARQLAFREADVFLLCYKITDPSTLFSALNHWCPEIRSVAADPQVPIILVGCGSDLRSDRDLLTSLAKQGRAPISADQALSFSHQIGAAMYVETSAKTSTRAAISAFEVAGLASMGKIVPEGKNTPSSSITPVQTPTKQSNSQLPPPVHVRAYSAGGRVARGSEQYYGTSGSTGSHSSGSNGSPLDSLERPTGGGSHLATPKHFRQSSSTSAHSSPPDASPPPGVGAYWETNPYSVHNNQSPVSRSVSVPRNPSVGGASSRSASLASNKTRSSTSIPSISGSKTPKSARKKSQSAASSSSSGAQEHTEKTVTIKCQRLTADKTYEEIEVEVPAPIYETIQLYNDTGSLSARATSSKERRKSIGTKLKNLFVKN